MVTGSNEEHTVLSVTTFTLMKSRVNERNADSKQYEQDTPTNLVLRI